MRIENLVREISTTPFCELTPAGDLPDLPEGYTLPNDLIRFYQLAGSARLHANSDFAFDVLTAREFIRANPLIVGEDCVDDISWDWFVIAKSEDQYVSIDLHPSRLGRCYDSSWDRHGLVGECDIVAHSFTDLLQALLESNGQSLFWLNKSFSYLGDAYEEVA